MKIVKMEFQLTYEYKSYEEMLEHIRKMREDGFKTVEYHLGNNRIVYKIDSRKGVVI